DAMRFTLTSLTVMGRDIKLPEKIIEGNRNFINKIWNATRFTLSHIERLGEPLPPESIEPGIFDRWILNRLKRAVVDMNRYLTDYRFNEAAKSAYAFVWHEFCDWYLEIIKPMLFGKLGDASQAAALSVLFHVLEQSLRLLHPIMPFVTEELWQTLPGTGETIMLSSFPEASESDIEKAAEAEQLIELINVVRNIRGENNIKPNRKIDIICVSNHKALNKNILVYQDIVQALAGIQKIELKEYIIKKEGLAGGVGSGFEVFVDMSESIDVAQETNRLEKEKTKLQSKQAQIQKKLNNKEFLSKAPTNVIDKNRVELSEIETKIEKIDKNIKAIKDI
ncbi:MAG: class I tRNA ligase family protein, partial [Deltaproteobacteria bacterium]|nr:class I tRNA ligase family protein [Deltaproteobacteria bacterium]